MVEKIHILLVDDEPDYLEPMSFWLRTKGYDVSIAPNGEKGIQLIKEKNPHIVFLDINMPGIDGIETLKRIRQFDQELPVIMVTAYTEMMKQLVASGQKFPDAQELKISGFFSKDCDFAELQKAIEVTIRTHKKLKEKS